MAEITNNLSNFQKDQLDALLSRSFNWHNRPQANVLIIGDLKITNRGDIILDQGRGIKWYKVAISFGTINNIQAISFYTNNLIRAWIDVNGLNIPSTSGLKWGTSESIAADTTNHNIKFYTSSTERVNIDANGLTIVGSTDIIFDTTGRGIKYSDIAVTMGTINSKNSVGFYANSTLRAYINSDGLTIQDQNIIMATSGKGIYFTGNGSTLPAILGTNVSIDMYVNTHEILGVADNGSSTTESGLFLRQNATLKQCHWIDGGDGFRYLACTHE